VPPERIKVIYNGVDPLRFHPDGAGAPPQRPTIANVGLIFPLKNQLGLIEAAALVRTRVPDVHVVLYGGASDDAYYAQCRERVARLGLQDTVTFAGPTTEPWKAYQQATVVAMSSVSEGFPYAVIEAMLCGAPIVATDTGGVSEAIDQAGVIVPPRDTARMAQALSDLLLDPGRRRELGARARARGLACFTQDLFLEQYRAAYAGLDQTGRAGVPGRPQHDPLSRVA
jgi:glycosyltransferase involved in cell wall biosynthesis